MKIAIITPFKEYYGGVETMNMILKSVFESNGHKVDIISLEDLEEREFTINSFKRYIIGKPYLTSKLFNNMDKQFDVIICNGEFGYGINHPKCINLFHGSDYGYKKYLSSKLSFKRKMSLVRGSLIQKLSSKNKLVITVSDFIKSILEEQGIKVNYVIDNCVNTNLFSPDKNKNRNNYLFVGSNLYYAKGFDILEKISKKGFNINCVTNSNPGKNLNWIKNIPNNKLPEVYNKHKVLIFPSRFEAAPLVPLEAMSCGLPIVMNNVGVGPKLKKHIPEFVIDKDYNIRKYIERLNLINKNYDHYSNLARKYILSNHSFEQFKNRWLRLVEEFYEDKLGSE